MSKFIATWLFLIALFPTQIFAQSKESRILATGSWCSRANVGAYFQEIDFETIDGKNEFRSFLHARPAEDGVWELDGKFLLLKASQGISWKYRILRITNNELVLELQEKGKNTIERYFRTKCALDEDEFKP